jgi:uncharacterized protein (PEP-CTERM system associated)
MRTVTVMVMVMAAKQKLRIDLNRLIVLAATMGSVAFPVIAGEWTIIPTIAVTETASDNIFLSSSQAKRGLVSDITPGISINGSGGRSKLHLNYQMHNLLYSTDPTANNQVQNALNASGTLEALENWFFIDASGVISQQSISAFGAAPVGANVNTNVNKNITETSSYSISPYVRGEFGSFADYQLRYNRSTTSSKAGTAYDSDTSSWVASLKGKTRLANLGWSLDGNAMVIDQGSLRSKEDNRLRGVLFYQINPQFQVSLIGGREENNYESLEMKSSTISGAGFSWSPTERTQMAFSRENRFFGPSNTLSFSHRSARTAWMMSSSEDVTSQPNGQQNTALGTNFTLLSSIYSSAIPDPVARAAFVNAMLLASGISPNAELQGGFQANQTVLQQLRQISFALLGVRNTVTFSATQNNTQNISLLTGAGVPAGSGPSLNNVDQLGANINWSHQLTPLSSLIGTVSRLNSAGTGTNQLETTQKSIRLDFVIQLGSKTNAGLGARRVISEGTTSYTENALTGTLSHRF